ncbi:MAG TPA: ATP-binding cassette domain-containing protein [Actinomycetota bacterium]|nr:ATP-binding cassette domain-containing protein [Actinomycetota bacterium]
MIQLERVTFSYPGGSPVLEDLELEVADGEFLLVSGASGSGKSTLLRVLNGLVPHYSGGRFSGKVRIGGVDVTGRPPRELADTVGFVPQDPESHATADRVVPELAFAMENLGVAPISMRKRIEEVCDAMGIAHLRDRRLDTLSGGERQRVAVAAVLAAQPKVLVLDEPTSSLDPQSAEDVLSSLVRLRDEFGLTIVCSEHRLERVAGFADRVCHLAAGRPPLVADPRNAFAQTEFAPPVTVLGRALGWSPLPLTVREGRRFATAVRTRPAAAPHRSPGRTILRAGRLRVRAGGRDVIHDLSIDLERGRIAALIGRNGSGKTTLLRTLCGLATPAAGRVEVDGRPPTFDRVAFLPQRAEALLFRETVLAEIASAAGSGDAARAWMSRLGLADLASRHPWSLSSGQRLRTALATVLARSPDVLLLDEPTRGLDPPAKSLLGQLLAEASARGTAVLLVTHDVELVARVADRVLLMSDGAIVADGPTGQVLGDSLLFSSQTSKVMSDPRYLTPEDVLAAMAAS